MREVTKGKWKESYPLTNVLVRIDSADQVRPAHAVRNSQWLRYLLTKLMIAKGLRAPTNPCRPPVSKGKGGEDMVNGVAYALLDALHVAFEEATSTAHLSSASAVHQFLCHKLATDQ